MYMYESPFPVSVITTTPTTTITGLNGPCGMTVNDRGQIVVTEWSNNIVNVSSEPVERK